MKKVIALISDCKDIQPFCKSIAERRLFYLKKYEVLEKQIEDLKEEMQKESEVDWNAIKDWLKANGKLPEDYNEDTQTLSFSTKENTISIEDDGDIKVMSLPKALEKLFGKLFNKENT